MTRGQSERYSFSVRLFHPLLSTGFHRRTARASRETAREALALWRSVRDAAVVADVQRIDDALAEEALRRQGIDEQGLAPLDRDYLGVLERARRPVGLATLAGRLAVARATLVETVEPFLLRRGLVRLTPHGRALARAGWHAV